MLFMMGMMFRIQRIELGINGNCLCIKWELLSVCKDEGDGTKVRKRHGNAAASMIKKNKREELQHCSSISGGEKYVVSKNVFF
jgi:hypothetical protein